MTTDILYTVQDKVATLTLNRPEKLNAFTDAMIERLIAALDTACCDDAVHVIVLTGAGRAFCSGGDVGGFQDRAAQSPAAIKRTLAESTQRLPKKFLEIEKPTIAAINGYAYGAGLDIALLCDLRFAAESAKLAETYARMGLLPGAGGAWLLPRCVGTARALEMLWTTEPITARDAERLGLINRVFPDSALMERTYAIARQVAEGAPLSLRLIKTLVYSGLQTDLRTALEMVAANLPIVRTSADHREAVAAFKAKRTPQFKGV